MILPVQSKDVLAFSNADWKDAFQNGRHEG